MNRITQTRIVMIPVQLLMMVCLRFACEVLGKSAKLCWWIDDVFDMYYVHRFGGILEQLRQVCAIMYVGLMSCWTMSELDDE